MISKEVRQESSIPVGTRVSMVSLAELDMFWREEGYNVRSMSQLVSWSLDLLCDVLKSNKKMPVEVESVMQAHNYLDSRNLYQKSSKKRGIKKIGTALGFESLREQGIDPKDYAPKQYKIVHNERSVQPSEVRVERECSDYNQPKIEVSEEEKERVRKLVENYRNNKVKKSMSMEEVREETLRIAEKAGVFNSSLKKSMNDCQVNQEQEAQGGSGMPRSIDNKEAQGNTGIPNTFNSINKTNKQEVQSASGITSVEGEGGKTSTVKEGMTDEELREKMERDSEKLREEERANEEFLKTLKQQS